MSRPLLLDLFCGAGGAAMGYWQAGFDVIGIDIAKRKNYPFTFFMRDALEFARIHGKRFAAIHASPPCQRYSVSTKAYRNNGKVYPDLVGQTREVLENVGVPWVIENVPGSPLRDPIILCGSHFGLAVEWEGSWYGLRRHRLFESNLPLTEPGEHDHSLPAITIAEHDVPSHQRKFGKSVPLAIRKSLMGMDWGSRDELGLAIPPAYTEYIGKQLIAALQKEAA